MRVLTFYILLSVLPYSERGFNLERLRLSLISSTLSGESAVINF